MNQKKLQQLSKNARFARQVHRKSGITLMVFILILSITGILLGWKKHSGEFITPNTYSGRSVHLKDWIPLDSISEMAKFYLSDKISENTLRIDRIDIRPEKGVAKVRFSNYWMVQVDGSNGQLLHIGKRNADIIEKIHDGSIVDQWFGFSNGFFKLVFSTTLGLALLLFIITGFIIWYTPILYQKYN
ncbi:PepSY-associated TM helix domain-containing protein [Saccharicrinis aurantiacus]|uniref:PepSY-associated TM helix domain-containing protein n=1 Tax=Saccharicrinis aurantiacus TaxID=1849719 RepID=UPI0009500BA4|nr:PepSY-associated TM helix domain-containing protein [Saccharicrinis aurantiacus]